VLVVLPLCTIIVHAVLTADRNSPLSCRKQSFKVERAKVYDNFTTTLAQQIKHTSYSHTAYFKRLGLEHNALLRRCQEEGYFLPSLRKKNMPRIIELVVGFRIAQSRKARTIPLINLIYKCIHRYQSQVTIKI